MAQPSEADDSRERAVSSEPCSTRPNPFDDSDISSRKRRRTSASGASRSRSVETVESPPAVDEGPKASNDSASAMKIDKVDRTIPTTPEQQPLDLDLHPQPPSGPRSSRVTINVRTPSRPLDPIPSSPSTSGSPTPASEPFAFVDDVKISVEESETDMSRQDTVLDTSVSVNSDGSSPPVEIVSVQPDEDVEFGAGEPELTILESLPRSLIHDPSGDFPFRETAETSLDIVNRLTPYLVTHASVSRDIADWIDNYLLFVEGAPYRKIADSYLEHRETWQSLPDLVLFMINRKLPYPQVTRHEIFRFYKAFARLAAFFIELDFKSLQFSTDQSRLPDLASPFYVQALGLLTRGDESTFHASAQFNANVDDDWSYATEVAEILESFQSYHGNAQGGSLTYLTQLALLDSELVSRFPKLTDQLAYLSVLASNVVQYNAQKLHSPNSPGVQHARDRVLQGYGFYTTMATVLENIVEKHVNHLSYEGASHLLNALTEIYQACLAADHIVPSEVIRDHRQVHPAIPPNNIPDAMSYLWKFKIHARLIMSSQMQLRVMAATAMCIDLVAIHRRFSEQSEEPSPPFLTCIAEYLLRSGLVGYILSPKCHPEVTIESSNIIGFLLVSRTYRPEHTDLLWRTVTSTQDPRISDALIKMTIRITHLLQPDDLMYLCEKLETVPVESFGPSMREFCAEIFRHLIPKLEPYDRQIAGSAPYDLCIRLIRQSSVFGSQSPIAYPDIHQFATHKFKELLAPGMTAEGRRKIYFDCLSDIAQKTPSTIGSLWVLCLVSRIHAAAREVQVAREVQILTSDYNLTTLLIEELEAAIPAARSAGYPSVLSGHQNAPRRDLLSGVLNYEPSTIPKNLGPKLWHLLVGPGAACREDRDVAWQLLINSLKRPHGNNPFASTCFSEYLPTLAPECFCQGTHDFVREALLPLVNDSNSIILDDEENPNNTGIEQMWRMALTAPEGTIERHAIGTLVNDIYLESRSILSFPHYRARKVHLSLIHRCLQQLSSAAERLRSFGDGTANGNDEMMAIVATDQQVSEQNLLFIRSLSILREFHRLHQAKGHFSAPDLRQVILETSKDVEGESAELKFQSFDGDLQTDIKPLNIGRRNTAASLFASLREATGFENYRIYYKGRPFVPQENEICKSLDDLQIHNGILLVKRESEVPSSPTRVPPGASRIEVEILGHFEELWEYLSMEEKLAQEIYSFLIKLPVDENTIEAIENPSTSYKTIFALGQPYKSLYAVHALREHLLNQRCKFSDNPRAQEDGTEDLRFPYTASLERIMSLLVSAISDPEIITQCPSVELQIELGSALLTCLMSLLQDSTLPTSTAALLDARLLDRLLNIISASLSADTSDGNATHTTLCLEIILEACARSSDFMSAFCVHTGIPRLLEDLLLRDPRAQVRINTALLILDRIRANHPSAPADTATVKFREFFWPLVSGMVGSAIRNASQSIEQLDLCFKMFQILRVAQPQILDIPQLLRNWGNLLLSYTTFEDLTQPDRIDRGAHALIRLLHTILCSEQYPAHREMLPITDVARKIFWKHLFPPFTKDSGTEPSRPILSSDSRMLLIQIIGSLVEDDPTQILRLLEDLDELVPVFPEEEDFYAYELPQQFERAKAIRASCGYAGLKNLSNTCYLNSLFTQLFMNTGFRGFMLNAEVQDRIYPQGLLFNTQKLFAFMQGTVRRSMTPEDVVGCIKTYEDTQIDIHNQMDVDEFYNLLFDRWEGQLLSSEEKRQFRSFYGGQLVQQVSSKECEHISERLEPFSAIQCDIKGKNSLEESLQAYVDGEIMEGDNKYKCSTCDRHVDAVKRACLKDIPDNLIFHLKRFDFNLRSLQRNKINDYFAFPTTIDMRPYTIEHLSNPTEEVPKDMFELVGVIVHSGTSESGHYYSYVRERPSDSDTPVWVEFNDENVSSWDPAHMENSCFGGPDYRAHFENTGVSYDKTYSAYMLFYQRSTSLAKEQDLLKKSGCTSPLRMEVSQELAQFIRDENESLLRRHCLYDQYQIQFVNLALYHTRSLNQEKCTSDHMMENLAITMAVSHLDQVASRTKDIPDFFNLLKRITSMCQNCVRCSFAVFEYFNRYTDALRMLIQRNFDAEVRQGAVGLMIRVLHVIRARARDQYGLQPPDGTDDDDEDDYETPTPVMTSMMRIFRILWDNFHMNLRSWPEVFDFMLCFVKMGRAETATFLQQPFFKNLLWIIYADPALELPPQFARMIGTITRRVAARQPSYEAIIDLLDILLRSMEFLTTDRGDMTGLDSPEQRLDHNPNLNRPFYFTKAEIKILQMEWSRGGVGIFVEKLIAINQNHSGTYSIVSHLMKYNRTMEERVYRTLRGAITGQMVQHSNIPYLRVAAHVFCRTSSRPELINNLIRYICQQCMLLQNGEGKAFLDFQKDVFDAPREGSGEDPEYVILTGLDNIPDWAPGLLGYFDSTVSSDTESFLQEKIFKFSPSPAFEDTERGRRRAQKLVDTARALGLRCLEYLGDNFVNGRGDVSTRLVAGLQRVIKECSKYFNLKDPALDEGAREFNRLCQMTLEPLRKIVVEDVEEDGSGMFHSDSSSVASSNTAC
ncbi:hypothetical protein B0H66DRAFT_483418 [Apodospora peruviana]|uniref:USP domain-containing protein n=1 Tax=Apodospora peruviana TaxID=516989 RepID=A0AAE0HW41_9PEZI|nr:hypothetical protein B0H66DRAFT_483418 [Apodospora peruviana]